jgi:hypothetical protein
LPSRLPSHFAVNQPTAVKSSFGGFSRPESEQKPAATATALLVLSKHQQQQHAGEAKCEPCPNRTSNAGGCFDGKPICIFNFLFSMSSANSAQNNDHKEMRQVQKIIYYIIYCY